MKRKQYLAAVALMAATIVFSSCGKSKAGDGATANVAATEQGEVFPNFDIADMERNSQSTDSLIRQNRITIIDFWASWCGPCRAEMPSVVALYEKYKDNGLGIIGISLDSDHEAWQTAVRDMKMSWAQLSELRGWDNTAVKTMSIRGIPYTIVVDNESKILAKDLRGQALINFINNLFPSETATEEKP